MSFFDRMLFDEDAVEDLRDAYDEPDGSYFDPFSDYDWDNEDEDDEDEEEI